MRGCSVCDEIQRKFSRFLTESAGRLVYGGEWNPQVIGVAHVSAADEGDILWDGEARFQRGMHGTDRSEVVVTKDGVRAWATLEQLSHRLSTDVFTDLLDSGVRDDERLRGRDSDLFEGVFVAAQPIGTRSEFRSRDVRDPALPGG